MTFMHRSFAAMIAVSIFALGLSNAYAEGGPAQRAGKTVDQVAEKVAKGVSKAVEKTGEALEKAGEKIQQVVKQTQKGQEQ